MELDALDRMRPMAHGHDLAVLGPRADLELVRHAAGGERVIAAGLDRVPEAGEDTASVVSHTRGLPVQKRSRLADLSAERLHDRLVAEADAEDRRRRAEAADQLDRASGAASGGPGRGR